MTITELAPAGSRPEDTGRDKTVIKAEDVILDFFASGNDGELDAESVGREFKDGGGTVVQILDESEVQRVGSEIVDKVLKAS